MVMVITTNPSENWKSFWFRMAISDLLAPFVVLNGQEHTWSDILKFFPQTVCPRWGVLTVGARGLGLDQGAPSDLRPFCCKFSHTSSLVRCPRAFRPRRLAQCGCRVLLVSKGVVLLDSTRVPCSFSGLRPFHVARVGHLRHFEVWNVVLRDRCRASNTFSCVAGVVLSALLKRWQAWVKMGAAFGCHFAWQAQCLVMFLEGSKV